VQFVEGILIALEALRANKLRTVLTLLWCFLSEQVCSSESIRRTKLEPVKAMGYAK